VTVEMHAQNGERSCKNEAIGGAHYGPVMVYMSKVADSSKADGSSGWFKGMTLSSFLYGLVLT
jgi:cellulase